MLISAAVFLLGYDGVRPLPLVGQLPHQVRHAPRREELVGAVVQLPPRERLVALPLGPHAEHLLQDVDVVRDREQVAAVLVGEEVVHLAEAGPGDAAEAEGAGLMGREEEAVGPRRRARGRVRVGGCEELLNAVDLAVQQRGGAFVVGRDGVGLEGLRGEDGGAEEFAAGRDAALC
ncbi:cytidine and deoxycytidylate deaminase zinc-binding region [Colletotrichum asianum]